MTPPHCVLAMLMSVHLVGLVVLVAALAIATATGLWHRRRDGRLMVRGDRDGRDHVATLVTSQDIGTPLGPRATLLQFSTSFCQPCRATRSLLADIARGLDGVVHTELDAETHMDLVRRLDVMRTPTVFVLDSEGHVLQRASGTPRRTELTAALVALEGRPA